jgi:ASC-1-like (ASCH) protein
MSAMQYFQSAHDHTKAPLIEYVLRSIRTAGKQYIENAEREARAAREEGRDVVPPDVSEEEADAVLIDVKNDIEYKSFIDELRQKTIDRIVKDVSKIISDKKAENDMALNFNATESSTFQVALEYAVNTLIHNQKEIPTDPEQSEQLQGLAVRESVLNFIDRVFDFPNTDIKNYISKIRFGNGVVINESTIMMFSEALNKRNQPKVISMMNSVTGDGVAADELLCFSCKHATIYTNNSKISCGQGTLNSTKEKYYGKDCNKHVEGQPEVV